MRRTAAWIDMAPKSHPQIEVKTETPESNRRSGTAAEHAEETPESNRRSGTAEEQAEELDEEQDVSSAEESNGQIPHRAVLALV